MSDELNAPPVFLCQRSGFKLPISEMVIEWTGLRVGRRFADKRNPQDFVRGVRDNQNLPVSQPESADVFLTTNQVTPDDL